MGIMTKLIPGAYVLHRGTVMRFDGVEQSGKLRLVSLDGKRSELVRSEPERCAPPADKSTADLVADLERNVAERDARILDLEGQVARLNAECDAAALDVLRQGERVEELSANLVAQLAAGGVGADTVGGADDTRKRGKGK